MMMRTMKTLLNVYDTIRKWKEANAYLGADALSMWMGANRSIVKSMEYIWSLEDQ